MSDPIQRLVMVTSPESNAAEDFRTLRTNLARHLSKGVRRILVASAWAGEGKTLVRANIGAALAQIQKRVIMIDADLRRPKLSMVLSMTELPGFSNVLNGETTAKECLKSTGLGCLQVLPAGTLMDANPTDLMSTEHLNTTLTVLTDQSDVLLVDSSPLAIFSEGFILAGKVDGVVLVVNPKRWRGEEEIQVKKQLEAMSVNILGMVLNEIDQNSNAADGYRYRYRYRYRNQ